ncbi:YigZ family protein [Oscillibacter sp.]|uniref:IMPACT family protein n=1 Tax=Oscillibacter sp. TaxID=1945593 RepID=UPI00257FAE45|nr:YigZ family protein [Oscillibacter sp.]
MTTYRVPFENGESAFTEKRSRFISHIWRVETEAEARERIEEMKKRYYDARHNCWCYLLQEGGVVRYSDDGEPQGTAGQPMLNVFQRESVTNVCCVVTRYFGGVLLGAGGLTRAYTKGAKDALAAVGISTMSLWTLWDVPCTYPFERVKLEIIACGGVVRDTEYGADIRGRRSRRAGRNSSFPASRSSPRESGYGGGGGGVSSRPPGVRQRNINKPGAGFLAGSRFCYACSCRTW